MFIACITYATTTVAVSAFRSKCHWHQVVHQVPAQRSHDSQAPKMSFGSWFVDMNKNKHGSMFLASDLVIITLLIQWTSACDATNTHGVVPTTAAHSQMTIAGSQLSITLLQLFQSHTWPGGYFFFWEYSTRHYLVAKVLNKCSRLKTWLVLYNIIKSQEKIANWKLYRCSIIQSFSQLWLDAICSCKYLDL